MKSFAWNSQDYKNKAALEATCIKQSPLLKSHIYGAFKGQISVNLLWLAQLIK